MFYKGITDDDQECFFLVLLVGDDNVNDVKLNISVKQKYMLKHLMITQSSESDLYLHL